MRPLTNHRALDSYLALRCALSTVLVFVTLGWAAPVRGQKHEHVRLVSNQEGVDIVDAASEHQETITAKPDCSHLVYEIFQLAGYPYPYANSADLYNGVPNFLRVRKPQAGDLVVWRGHVGIVVDPREHSFYSSLRSGLQTSDYTAPYWRRYGSPKFYRYVKPGYVQTAASRQSGQKIQSASLLAGAASPQEHLAQSTTRSHAIAGSMEGNDSPKDWPDGSRDGMGDNSIVSRTAISSTRVLNASSRIVPTRAVAPGTLITTEKGKPTLHEANAALSKWIVLNEQSLSTADMLDPQHVVIVYDQLRVDRLRYKHNDRGWMYLKVDANSIADAAEGRVTQQPEKESWELRHTAAGWFFVQPADRLYVSHHTATRLLSQKLAVLKAASDESPSQSRLREESRVAAMLKSLSHDNK